MRKLCLLLFILFVFQSSKAQESYSKLQAVYLYNFAKYIKWSHESPQFIIGIFGNNKVVEYLQVSSKSKKINGKYMEVRELKEMEEMIQCQIIYLAKSKSKYLSNINQLVDGKGILIVTEEDLSKKGAAISFFIENDHVRFKLNPRLLSKAGLTASSGLLGIAIISE